MNNFTSFMFFFSLFFKLPFRFAVNLIENMTYIYIYIYIYIADSIPLSSLLTCSNEIQKSTWRFQALHESHGFCLKFHSVVNQTHRDYVPYDMNACWLPKEIMSYFPDCTILWNSLNWISFFHLLLSIHDHSLDVQYLYFPYFFSTYIRHQYVYL
jgi:hypothetical protein